MHGGADRGAGLQGDDQRRRPAGRAARNRARARALSRSTATGSTLRIPCWPGASTPRPHPQGAGRCTAGSPKSSTSPSCARGTWPLAATSGDDVTLRALDKAAESARARGAPAAAAELMDLAIGLGGDSPERRLRSALHHFDAGDHERARRRSPGDRRPASAERSTSRSVVPLGRSAPLHRGLLRDDPCAATGAERRGRRQSASRADTDHVGVLTHARQRDRRGQGDRRTSGGHRRESRSATLAQPGVGHASHPGLHGGRRSRRRASGARTRTGGPTDRHSPGVPTERAERPAVGVDRRTGQGARGAGGDPAALHGEGRGGRVRVHRPTRGDERDLAGRLRECQPCRRGRDGTGAPARRRYATLPGPRYARAVGGLRRPRGGDPTHDR